MPALTRAFLAVPAGERLAAELASRLDVLDRMDGLRRVRPEAWHLTLQFLGDWPDDRLDALGEGLSALAGVPAWEQPVGSLGGFPRLADPRVLFLQLEGDPRLADLALQARRLVDAVWSDGPQDRRAFRAHLTLARVRGKLEHEGLKVLRGLNLDGLPSLPVNRVQLMASTLSPTGAEHRILGSIGLRKKGE